MMNTLPELNAYSFSMKPENHKPSGTCNIDKMYVFDTITTIYNPKTNTQTKTNHGTIKLTPEEYTYMLTSDLQTEEQYVSAS